MVSTVQLFSISCVKNCSRDLKSTIDQFTGKWLAHSTSAFPKPHSLHCRLSRLRWLYRLHRCWLRWRWLRRAWLLCNRLLHLSCALQVLTNLPSTFKIQITTYIYLHHLHLSTIPIYTWSCQENRFKVIQLLKDKEMHLLFCEILRVWRVLLTL